MHSLLSRLSFACMAAADKKLTVTHQCLFVGLLFLMSYFYWALRWFSLSVCLSVCHFCVTIVSIFSVFLFFFCLFFLVFVDDFHFVFFFFLLLLWLSVLQYYSVIVIVVAVVTVIWFDISKLIDLHFFFTFCCIFLYFYWKSSSEKIKTDCLLRKITISSVSLLF